MEADVLIEGFRENRVVDGHVVSFPLCSSVVLLRGEHNFLVDTSHFSYGERLIGELEKHGMTSKDIDYVINTHGHLDHVGNNHLFADSRIVMHRFVWGPGERCEIYSGTEEVPIPEIELLATPGHTADHISVVAEIGGKRFVAAGDAVREDDVLSGRVPENYFSADLYFENMLKLLASADVIVPGHGRVLSGRDLKELREKVEANF